MWRDRCEISVVLVLWWGEHFASYFKLFMVPITCLMSSTAYTDLLQQNLIPRNRFVSHKDNASIHASRQTKTWLESPKVALLERLACSPECSPIANLRGVIGGKAYSQWAKNLNSAILAWYEQRFVEKLQ